MTAAISAGLRLPFRFDPELLHRDLAMVEAGEWSPHYNERDFGGQWQGVSLRSTTGSHRDIAAGPPGQLPFKDTSLMKRCDYFREVLGTFQCSLKSVRLLSLAPGSFIREHTDRALGYQDGEVRIHIPIQTNPGVEFYVCGELLRLDEAGCYYINVNLPHRVSNRGAADRVHLVIDACVDDWVRELFEKCIANGHGIPRSRLRPGSFNEFADLVHADPSLRERLRAIPDRDGLLRALEHEAASRSFDLNEADIQTAFRSGPPAESGGEYPDREGWVPIRVTLDGAQPRSTCIYAPDHRFIEPFFEDSVKALLCNPFTALFTREMPLRPAAPIRPQGFIFHISRCGSTLISRSLASLESMLVMSEPEPVDEVVQVNRPEWLEWIVSALGQARVGSEARYLIKLDSWHIRALPMFRAVFPEVPWIFVYRDPLEVLVSHLSRPGRQALPGAMDPSILGMWGADITGLTRPQWCVQVLENFMRAALSFRDDPYGMFVDYRELPGAVWGRIQNHFGLELNAEDEAQIREAARADAKNPCAEYVDDREIKRHAIESMAPGIDLSALKELHRQLQALTP